MKMLIAALFNSLYQRIGINLISIKIENENLVWVYIEMKYYWSLKKNVVKVLQESVST